MRDSTDTLPVTGDTCCAAEELKRGSVGSDSMKSLETNTEAREALYAAQRTRRL